MENRLVVQELLKPVGISTWSVGSGEDALEMVTDWKPDLILMDLRMPGMDGFECARRIKGMEEGKNVPIIALTASIFEVNDQKVFENGMEGYIQKPFKDEELFTALEDKLGKIFVYHEKPVTEDAHRLPVSGKNGGRTS